MSELFKVVQAALKGNAACEIIPHGAYCRIHFEEGWRTGSMTETGLEIVVSRESGQSMFSGCIERKDARKLRDWLATVIDQWDEGTDQE